MNFIRGMKYLKGRHPQVVADQLEEEVKIVRNELKEREWKLIIMLRSSYNKY